MSIRDEATFEFARAGGPGGQNVNKTNTKATVRWRIGTTRTYSAEEQEQIRKRLANRRTINDELLISSSGERSQLQNKTKAIALLEKLVHQALVVRKARHKTKTTRSAKLRRLESKTKRSLVKRARRFIHD